MNIISAQNIVKQFHNHIALNNASIHVPEKSIFGLLGPNGAGKTTLIRIINQITMPDSGQVFFNQEALSPKHIQQIGYLPEERGLYKKMEVGEQCLYLAQLKGLDKKTAKQRLNHWFEKFEMKGWWNKKVEDLSKGMQQKVQFVATILHEPQVLILDEPFSGFDPINAQLIQQEMIELKKKGHTIILSTHNMNSVEELCDHIALINNTQTILEGSVKEIKHRYKSNRFEIDFTGNGNDFKNALTPEHEILHFTSPDSYRDEEQHHKAIIKIEKTGSANKLLQSVLATVAIHSFKEMIPSMNDIFISKIKEVELHATSNLTE
jgi:ABC-2 type transport system ATP-binding protein